MRKVIIIEIDEKDSGTVSYANMGKFEVIGILEKIKQILFKQTEMKTKPIKTENKTEIER